MKTPSKKNKGTQDEEGETNGGDPYMSESNVADLPLTKSNDDQHLIKSNKSEDDEQGKKKNKKKKQSEESKHKEDNTYKSNEFEDDDQRKKMKKMRELIEGNTLKECNDVRSDEGEEGQQGKKKKKKLSEESKHKESNKFKSNECEDDDQGKKMKKKQKLIEGNTLKECNDSRSKGDEDGKQENKMKKKKKKPSEESNECEDDQGKRTKKNQKLIEGNTLNECNDLRSNGGEDGEQDKMKKKKKLSEESKHKENSEFKTSECEDDGQGKKMKKKKKQIEEAKLKEYSDIIINEGGDGDQGKAKKKDKLSHKRKSKENNDQGKKMKKKKEAKAVASESPNCAHDKGKTKKDKLSRKRKSKENNDLNSNEGDAVTGVNDQGTKMKKKKEAKAVASESPNCAHDKGKTKKKDKLSRKRKSKENNDLNSNEGDAVTGVNDQGTKMKKKKEAKAVASESPNSAHGKTPNSGHNGTSKRKRVTFADEVETHCCDGLVRGKRYTPEEDEKIKAAVYDYIDSHGLGDEGLDKILHCRSHPELIGCWKEIAKALPERPAESVYKRAHSLLENSERCKWTPDELEFIRKSYEKHGADWRMVAEALDKSRDQVKDAWRRIKYTNVRRGTWSQEEYQNLFNLVNLDLRVRASEPYKKSNHGMLRDNICWETIAHKLGTRNSALCCKKWYEELTSPMVASGDWCDTDDYRLINALYTLDACCMEEVDWDNLLELRSGDACRKRWDQMVHHIGEHTAKSFVEQVEVLTKRFCPDLLEAREAFDNKPVIC
uniref:MYB family transcription factor n=1 Tax=Melilotus albus TaxID=47082 RepID=A0A896W357_MELAB|nr:MYB family transcription factor [Melilotus albus]